MSALCQKATSPAYRSMSALSKSGHCKNRKSTELFDYFIGNGKNAGRHREAKSLCGFQVEHKFEFDGLHDRQVGWTFSPQNSTGVDARLAVWPAAPRNGAGVALWVNRRKCQKLFNYQ